MLAFFGGHQRTRPESEGLLAQADFRFGREMVTGAGSAPADDRSFTIDLTGAATRANPAGVHRVVVTIQGED